MLKLYPMSLVTFLMGFFLFRLVFFVFVCRSLEGQPSNQYLRVGSLQEKSNEDGQQRVWCSNPLSSPRVRGSYQCGRLMLPQEALPLVEKEPLQLQVFDKPHLGTCTGDLCILQPRDMLLSSKWSLTKNFASSEHLLHARHCAGPWKYDGEK